MKLVTTAGKVGTRAAQLLADNGEDVRVLVRDPGAHGDLRDAGVDVVAGDLDDEASVRAALDGVDGVLLVSPAVPAQELRIVDAAAHVEHLVKVSSKASPDSPVARRRNQSVIEAGLADSSIPHTLLRPNAYMQNLLALGPLIATTGEFSASTGTGQVGLTDAADVAAVAAHVLGDPAAHAGKTYWITGPQLLSYGDVAEVLSDVLDRRITFTPRSRAEDLQAFLAAGLPEDVAHSNADAFSLIADGDAAWLSQDPTDLLHRPAHGFADFARSHAQVFTAT